MLAYVQKTRQLNNIELSLLRSGRNASCVPYNAVCDSKPDCPHREDESNCVYLLPVRLMNEEPLQEFQTNSQSRRFSGSDSDGLKSPGSHNASQENITSEMLNSNHSRSNLQDSETSGSHADRIDSLDNITTEEPPTYNIEARSLDEPEGKQELFVDPSSLRDNLNVLG